MISRILNPSIRLMSAVIWLAAATVAAADPPRPTPRPGTLGAYARKVKLNRPAPGEVDGRLVLSNASVTELAADGTITLGKVARAEPRKAKTSGVADNAERARWRAAHHRQRQVITGLERNRSRLEVEIDQIEDQGLTAKTMARLDLLAAKLQQIDRDIAAERAELARIVRDARRRGAEPGWFR